MSQPLVAGRHERSQPSAVLVGFESAGKSALFRGLTGQTLGDETNFRGSTVVCRSGRLTECDCTLVDTPGIRIRDDSKTTDLALAQLRAADVVVLVVRATDLRHELELLSRELGLTGRRGVVAITFEDKAPNVAPAALRLAKDWGAPVVALNAREMSAAQRLLLLQAIRTPRPLGPPPSHARALHPLPVVKARPTLLEHPRWGAIAALSLLLLALAAPVAAAFWLAEWLQPSAEQHLVAPLRVALGHLSPLLDAVLLGPYGLLTLGTYSFIWAFPVVLLIGLTTALGLETGVHDRATTALDPWLRRVGLTGRDLTPLLTGFGCNVVAVLQSRSCSSCSRSACVSLIAFGSACSYQIGATLSIFGSAGLPWLFVPYLLVVFTVGVLHTRIWYPALSTATVESVRQPAFLQWPAPRAVWWRLRGTVKQFLGTAMPVFLLMCVAAALATHWDLMGGVARLLGPVVRFFGLPANVAMPVALSVLRKDGMLLLNEGSGTALHALTKGQVFVAVFLASTLTACVVTLWTLGRELGWQAALRIAGRQVVTSVLATTLISALVRAV